MLRALSTLHFLEMYWWRLESQLCTSGCSGGGWAALSARTSTVLLLRPGDARWQEPPGGREARHHTLGGVQGGIKGIQVLVPQVVHVRQVKAAPAQVVAVPVSGNELACAPPGGL